MNAERMASAMASVQHILVAVDASPHGLAALEQAMALAVRLGADVTAVFVEDINVVRLGNLPVVRHLAFSGDAMALEPAAVEAMIRSQVQRVRAAVEGIAQRSGVPTSLQIVRGRVADELLAAATAAGADLVVVGWSSAPASESRRLGSTAHTLAHRGRGPVLVLKEGTRVLTALVAAVFDGSEGAARALELAAALATTDSSRLTVLLVTGREPGPAADKDVETLKAQATSLLERYDLDLRFQRVSAANCPRISAVVAQVGVGVLVVAADSPLMGECEAENRPLDVFGCPVLIVR